MCAACPGPGEPPARPSARPRGPVRGKGGCGGAALLPSSLAPPVNRGPCCSQGLAFGSSPEGEEEGDGFPGGGVWSPKGEPGRCPRKPLGQGCAGAWPRPGAGRCFVTGLSGLAFGQLETEWALSVCWWPGMGPGPPSPSNRACAWGAGSLSVRFPAPWSVHAATERAVGLGHRPPALGLCPSRLDSCRSLCRVLMPPVDGQPGACWPTTPRGCRQTSLGRPPPPILPPAPGACSGAGLSRVCLRR